MQNSSVREGLCFCGAEPVGCYATSAREIFGFKSSICAKIESEGLSWVSLLQLGRASEAAIKEYRHLRITVPNYLHK